MTDLWPDDFGNVFFSTPVAILKDQAALLRAKTHNIVTADVVPLSRDEWSGDTFDYLFYLVAPLLDDYRYKLLTISYNIDLYPVTIHSDVFRKGAKDVTAASQTEFLTELEHIFKSEQTKRVIQAIIAQSMSMEVEQPT